LSRRTMAQLWGMLFTASFLVIEVFNFMAHDVLYGHLASGVIHFLRKLESVKLPISRTRPAFWPS
jgi:hypothetical protein